MVSREGRIHLHTKLSDAYRLSEEALIVVGGHILVRDPAAGRLEADTPFSFKSMGEKIKVEVSGVDGDVLVQLKSASRMRTTLFDWGKNADNIQRLTDWLTKSETKA